MLYRKLGTTNLNVSILGFGCMRLPILNGSGSSADIFDPNKVINEEETKAMIQYAIDHGVNYFDTAYPYHSGRSEPLLGEAVKGCRNKVMIATKLPVWLVNEKKDFSKFLDEQMTRLGTDYLDVYLLHGLNRQVWPKMRQLGVFEFLDQIRVDGRVRHVGFSFHDDVKIFKEIVDSYDWGICQIQYNYLNEDVQAGSEGLTFLPHLMGAFSPEYEPEARGAVYGLTLRHGKGHMVRAILEGVAFMLRRNLELLAAAGAAPPGPGSGPAAPRAEKGVDGGGIDWRLSRFSPEDARPEHVY